MTNICFFNTTKFWGGGEKWHFETAAYLSEHGHQVFLIAHPHSELQKRITPTHVITFPLAVSNFSFLNLYKMHKLISFFRSRRIKTVVFNASSDVKLGAIAARIAGVKAIVYRRGIAVPVKNTWVNRLLYGRILTHLLTNSKETARALLQRLEVPQAAKRIRTIYNGIDVSHFSPSPLHHGGPEALPPSVIIGSAGRLIALKGHSYLIDIASRLKKQNLDFRILIAGEGSLRHSLQNQIKKRGLEDVVQLLGFVADMREFLQQIDIFLFPSMSEGFGYAIAEAMSAALPVVAFDAGSIPELIENGQTGFLVPPNDLKNLTKKTMLLAGDPHLRKRMGSAGKKRVQQMFDQKKQLSKLETYLCQEVLSDNKI
ncbi:MAG: glycosyltransferase [Desulfobacteraceae bacterium]|jgi:glycosyltransferase involved in cell wall biosynthesis